MSAKFDNLQTFLDSFNLNNSDRCIPAFIALSETWLNDLNAPTFKINNYHPPLTKNRNDRTSRGGVAIYVREDINFVPRPEFSIFIPFVFESVFRNHSIVPKRQVKDKHWTCCIYFFF